MAIHHATKLTAAILLSSALLSGCTTTDSYNQAFTHKSAPAGNGHHINADQNRAFKAARAELVQQGFAIQSMDSNLGVIKATRGVQDLRNKDMTYSIVATVDITNIDANSSIVSLAANQQSILHTVSHDWWHLLFIIPLFPIGTHYENVVVNEGEVIDPKFYQGFFDGLNQNLAQMPPPIAAAPTPAVVAPAVVETASVVATPVAPKTTVIDVSSPVEPAASITTATTGKNSVKGKDKPAEPEFPATLTGTIVTSTAPAPTATTPATVASVAQ